MPGGLGGPVEVPAEAPALFMEARPGGPGDSSSGSEEERLCLVAQAGRSLSGQLVGAAGRGVTAAVGPETAWTPLKKSGVRPWGCPADTGDRTHPRYRGPGSGG